MVAPTTGVLVLSATIPRIVPLACGSVVCGVVVTVGVAVAVLSVWPKACPTNSRQAAINHGAPRVGRTAPWIKGIAIPFRLGLGNIFTIISRGRDHPRRI